MDWKRYWRWGVTAVASVCAILVFHDTVFQKGVLLLFFERLLKVLSPVIYGFALAYLLTPIVRFFDAQLRRLRAMEGHPVLARGLSILLAWLLTGVLVYLLLSILLPQLYLSVVQLAGNMEDYYISVNRWVRQLLEKNPGVAKWITGAFQEYYRELVGWVTGTWIPQAQQTLAMVTGGVLSVLVFLKDLLVGMIVSVYLLAMKESFSAGGKRLLYSFVSEKTYSLTLRALRRTDEIFSGFVRGKLLDSLIIGFLCFIGASVLNLPYAPLVSVIIGATNVIPFFGPFLGAIPCAFLILIDSPIKCLYFIIFILVLQQFDGNILGPRILGGSTNLPSFWVIVAILLGGGFFGVAGMFLGVPVFACVYAAVKALSEKRLLAKGSLPPDLPVPVSAPPQEDADGSAKGGEP